MTSRRIEGISETYEVEEMSEISRVICSETTVVCPLQIRSAELFMMAFEESVNLMDSASGMEGFCDEVSNNLRRWRDS